MTDENDIRAEGCGMGPAALALFGLATLAAVILRAFGLDPR